MKNARGFTLIELLVAITVMAIVAVMGWRGLDTIVRSREQLTQAMEQTRGLQLTFAQLQSDLEQIADKTLLREHQNILADNNRLIFIRTVLPENAPSQLQVISYVIREGVLSRSESPLTRDLGQLDSLWQAATGQSTAQATVGLYAGVESMQVRVWEGGGWKSPQNASTSVTNGPQDGGAPACADPDPRACQGKGTPNPGAGGNPPGTVPPPVPVQRAEGPTGLEVTLQIQGQPTPLTKVFLLGAV